MILVCSGEVIFNFVFISGLWKREIVIYSISTGGLTIFIFVCMVLLQRYKKRNGRKGPDNQIPYEPQTENKEPVILEINDCDRNSARCDPMENNSVSCDPMQNNSVSYDPMKSNSVSCNPMQNNSMSCHPM